MHEDKADGGTESTARGYNLQNGYYQFMDDFLQALDANPSWREAVRARILGEELLRLPVRFETFAQEQRAFNEEQRAFNEEVRTFIADQGTINANFQTRFNRLEGDIGTLKGDYAMAKTKEDAPNIAEDMGLQFVRLLTIGDLSGMAGSDLPRDVHRSFRNADLVIEATDGVDTCYIAMEVSFTADGRDCERAIRNAALITRFTGKPAQAAIASMRNDQEATQSIESGAVYWHTLDDRIPSSG